MRDTNLLVDDYYNWLLGLISNNEYYVDEYTKVLDKLFNTEFYDLVKNDDNRIKDGLELRNRFADEVGEHLYYVIDKLPPYCSILEMMIALAIRWESDVQQDPDLGDRSSEWFWLMMDNLGLLEFDNKYYDDEIVSDILQEFLDRKYCKDGTGGLFMVKNSKIDMRKVEIWYQINYYFKENFNKF